MFFFYVFFFFIYIVLVLEIEIVCLLRHWELLTANGMVQKVQLYFLLFGFVRVTHSRWKRISLPLFLSGLHKQ